jgi:hypothetical protein
MQTCRATLNYMLHLTVWVTPARSTERRKLQPYCLAEDIEWLPVFFKFFRLASVAPSTGPFPTA